MSTNNTDNNIIATVPPSSPSTPNIGDVIADNDEYPDGVNDNDDDDDDNEIDVNEPLEVDYGDDDDDDDIDDDDDDDDAGSVGEFKISLRTGAIM
jgi:hypothetical protein